MKTLFLTIGLILFGSNVSFAGDVIFHCQKAVQVAGKRTVLYFEIADLAGPVGLMKMDGKAILNSQGQVLHEVRIEQLDQKAFVDNHFIPSILRLMKHNSSLAKSAIVYEIERYRDDGAGGVGVQFLDAKSLPLEKGMIFGWAGAMICDR